MSPADSGDDVVITRDLTVEGRHGPISARLYHPKKHEAGPGFLWLHGGGFIGGDLDMPEADWVSRSLAGEGFTVVSGDYTKCLEGIHYPVPNDDVLDLWRWTAEHVVELGIDPAHLHLGGASAGGALAASVAKRLRDGGGPDPRSVVLVYPVLHYDLVEPQGELRDTLREHADEVFAQDLTRSLSDNYLGGPTPRNDPYAFPANGELSGLPPTYVLNSEIDSLRASGEAYADGLWRAGVEARVEYEAGTVHGHLNEPSNPFAVQSISRMAAWLRTH